MGKKTKVKISDRALEKSEDFFMDLARSSPRKVDFLLANAQNRDLEVLTKLLFNTCNGQIGMNKDCHQKFSACNRKAHLAENFVQKQKLRTIIKEGRKEMIKQLKKIKSLLPVLARNVLAEDRLHLLEHGTPHHVGTLHSARRVKPAENKFQIKQEARGIKRKFEHDDDDQSSKHHRFDDDDDDDDDDDGPENQPLPEFEEDDDALPVPPPPPPPPPPPQNP